MLYILVNLSVNSMTLRKFLSLSEMFCRTTNVPISSRSSTRSNIDDLFIKVHVAIFYTGS